MSKIAQTLGYASPFGQDSIFLQDTWKGKLRQLLLDNNITGFGYQSRLFQQSGNSVIQLHGFIEDGQLKHNIQITAQAEPNDTLPSNLTVPTEVAGFKIPPLLGNNKAATLIYTQGPDNELTEKEATNIFSPSDVTAFPEISEQTWELLYKAFLKSGLNNNAQNRKDFNTIGRALQKQLSNEFYKDVKVGITHRLIDQSNQQITHRTYKTPGSEKEHDVNITLTQHPNGDIQQHTQLSPNLFAKQAQKWQKEANKRGLEIDIVALQQKLIKELEDFINQHPWLKKATQVLEVFIKLTIGVFIESIQATQKAFKYIWKHGEIDPSLWHSKNPEHEKWPPHLRVDPYAGGLIDGVIDEIIGIPLAIKGIYELATDEKQQKALKEMFTKEGFDKLLDGLAQDFEDFKDDPEIQQHFFGETTVGAVTMVFGIGLITKAGKIGNTLTSIASKTVKMADGKIMRTANKIKKHYRDKPKVRKQLEDFQKEVGVEKYTGYILEADGDKQIFRRIIEQPIQFILGKRFERNVERLIDAGNRAFLSKIAREANIDLAELSQYKVLHQVQINLPDGGFIVADNVWVKTIQKRRGKSYEVIINECKLSSETNFTNRQKQFLKKIGNLDDGEMFTIRSKKDKITQVIPAGSEIKIKSYIRTSGFKNPYKISNLEPKKVK